MTTDEIPQEEIPSDDNEDQQIQQEPEEQTPDDAGEEQSSDSKPQDQLLAILEAAKTSRLAPGDEDRAIELLEQTIMGGPKALPAAIEAILALPWSASVKAVTDAWPDTKPAGRTRLLAGLAKADSDASRRIRLSLARGLHAQDPAAAAKLVSGVCEAMGGAQGGSSTKDRQIFANVMLGKARPWLMNISMAEMKPADALKIIVPALESCHQAPIFTQIWVLRWICDAEQFDALTPEHIESIGKSINRWQSRWHKELRKIIPKLPDSLENALGNSSARPSAPLAAIVGETSGDDPAGPPDTGGVEVAPIEPAFEESDAPEAREPARTPLRETSHRSRDRRSADISFDLVRSLREIESYVVRLRSDLAQAQGLARRRESAPERHRPRAQAAAPSAEELDELRRHNLQLEEQNQELRHRIEELASDHEDRAATLEIADSLEQFKTFLGLKLKEDYADYTAISREALNEVVRRHAHEILGRIFSILQAEGVRFDREN